jgi:hypothetical protein
LKEREGEAKRKRESRGGDEKGGGGKKEGRKEGRKEGSCSRFFYSKK